MNNRTLWTIVGVVLLVVIALLVFGVISIPMTEVTQTTTSTSTAAIRCFEPSIVEGFRSAPALALAA